MEPFNLSTEQRGTKRRRWAVDEEKSNSSVEKKFKAKAMPNYKFFEVKKESKQTSGDNQFAEFNLRTNERSTSRRQRNSLPAG